MAPVGRKTAKTSGEQKLIATEQQIHRSLVEHLRWRAKPSAFWFHCPSGAYFGGTKQGAIMKSLGWIAGVPDLILIDQSRPLGLELKRQGGRLSDDQRAVHERMRRAGAEVSVVYDVDAALDQLSEWKLLR